MKEGADSTRVTSELLVGERYLWHIIRHEREEYHGGLGIQTKVFVKATEESSRVVLVIPR